MLKEKYPGNFHELSQQQWCNRLRYITVKYSVKRINLLKPSGNFTYHQV
jgi:hypothetical protein